MSEWTRSLFQQWLDKSNICSKLWVNKKYLITGANKKTLIDQCQTIYYLIDNIQETVIWFISSVFFYLFSNAKPVFERLKETIDI